VGFIMLPLYIYIYMRERERECILCSSSPSVTFSFPSCQFPQDHLPITLMSCLLLLHDQQSYHQDFRSRFHK
jgi:hypothetical protein